MHFFVLSGDSIAGLVIVSKVVQYCSDSPHQRESAAQVFSSGHLLTCQSQNKERWIQPRALGVDRVYLRFPDSSTRAKPTNCHGALHRIPRVDHSSCRPLPIFNNSLGLVLILVRLPHSTPAISIIEKVTGSILRVRVFESPSFRDSSPEFLETRQHDFVECIISDTTISSLIMRGGRKSYIIRRLRWMWSRAPLCIDANDEICPRFWLSEKPRLKSLRHHQQPFSAGQ